MWTVRLDGGRSVRMVDGPSGWWTIRPDGGRSVRIVDGPSGRWTVTPGVCLFIATSENHTTLLPFTIRFGLAVSSGDRCASVHSSPVYDWHPLSAVDNFLAYNSVTPMIEIKHMYSEIASSHHRILASSHPRILASSHRRIIASSHHRILASSHPTHPCRSANGAGRKRSTKLDKHSNISLTVCWILESDSYYSSYERLAGAVDLALANANAYILPDNVKLHLAFGDAGPSCSNTQYSVTANVLSMIQSGTSCDVFLGVGCPSTAVALYGIADNLNTPILGCPAAGTASLALNPAFDRFPLLIRASYGFTDIVYFMNSFLKQNGYDHLAILRDDSYNFFNTLSKFALVKFKKINPVLSSNTFEYAFMSAQSTLESIKALISTADDVTRVFWVLAHGDSVRQIMIAASQLGVTQGEYLFIGLELFELKYWGAIRFDRGDTYDAVSRLHGKHSKAYCIMMYAQEIAEMVANATEELTTAGNIMVSRMLGSVYKGLAGPMKIGMDGERDVDLELRTFNMKEGEFQSFYEYIQLNFTAEVFRYVKNFTFAPSLTGRLPANEPRCGYRGERCLDQGMPTGVLAVAIVVPLLAVLGMGTGGIIIFLKLRKLRQDYNPNWWKITSEELIIKQNRTGSGASKRTLASQSTAGTSGALTGYSSFMCDILATYKGSLVALTEVTEFKKHPTPDLVNRLTLIKACVTPNLQKFFGIGLSSSGMCEYIVNEPCSKGSLTDILDNEVIKLDWSFKNSLIKDIVFGMTYLHTSPIVSHGNLNSHTCLIDGRFTLKISDYGLPFFRKPEDLLPPRPTETVQRSYELLLWRAPELLRQVMPVEGTQKGDVYSFAIILQQLILRSGPFELPNDPLELSNRELLQEVIAANIPPVRPRVPRASCSNELYDLMERCWEEVPVERPTFPKIKERLKKVIGDVGDNIVDLLFKRMEQYAMDLELKVAEKTQQFMDEKTRSEQLLSQLLPKLVAAALTRGEHVDPEAYESVTIFFSDIVGFTTISAAGSPMDVISLLNGLYTFFDGVLEKFDVYKVETIGDAYMVSSGLPVRNGNRHAAEIAHMSLDLLKGIRLFVVPNRANVVIEIRAGINSGPCVAGIVGLKMPRYCLFGDTVNVASRMESTGEPMKIQITVATKDLLTNIGGFITAERGPVTVKGKGTLITHWLLSSESS
ncbi:Atrial natriuretic peptide receptor 1 [Hypsibius exemplaris]|uniref:Guanylate cyclase n=1 Tax=Hypsibius exemplaris TaxID=2072580 RepID=A0A1W0WAP1_HYPEX|nr:Atrial natriuretic peptide receptor 1 [Hypsibius exemplaris]